MTFVGLGKVQEVIEMAPLPVLKELYTSCIEVWPIPNTGN